ncbi:MAG: hypothetical protein U9P36_03165 [Thermodesulfobacteriota bacterium]|nr:hypothetical protein [Thermodesulfobacteriota bacterium]
MLQKAMSFIFFILFMTVGIAQAQVSINYSSQGVHHFSMTIADSWRVNVGSEEDASQLPEGEKPMARLITAMPDDGTPLWFGMWVPPNVQKIKEAKEYMDSLGLELLADMVTTKRTFDTLNGMDVFHVSGTGEKEGEPMDFHAAFVQLSKEKVAIAIYIGPHETTISHGDELLQMVHSLQPGTHEQGGGS